MLLKLQNIKDDENLAGSVKTFLSLIQGIEVPKQNKDSCWEEFWSELLDAMPNEPIKEQII